MSGQAKRSRVLAAQRHREQVARAIATGFWPSDLAADRARETRTILGGQRFNVAKAREYGEQLTAEGLRWQGARAVVDDWRRGQGWEPVETLVHRKCRVCRGSGADPQGVYIPAHPIGGPSEADPCPACGGVGTDGYLCVRCDPPGLPPDVPGFALNWQASVRLGRRLLAALEGQPSRCTQCGGGGRMARLDVPDIVRPLDADSPPSEAMPKTTEWTCERCHGTGHNLHGVLPPVELSDQVVRAVSEGIIEATAKDRGPADWQLSMARQVDTLRPVARVVPRGEQALHGWDASPVGLRGWASWLVREGVGSTRDFARGDMLAPRWRRGELKHAEQRRERAAARAVADERHDQYWERQRQGWQAGLGAAGQVSNVDAPTSRPRGRRGRAPVQEMTPGEVAATLAAIGYTGA